jgi:GST-like protein
MIELFYWPTPNGWKVSIALEELGLPYVVRPVDITKGEQFEPAFLRISPNNRIPAIVDPDGPDGAPISLFESGAILVYLADKTGRFLPADPTRRFDVLQCLMFQMGNVGPMFGQLHHFKRAVKERLDYPLERYERETRRLYGVLDQRLGETPYLAGADYTIADIATYPWVARHDWQGVDLGGFPRVKRWFEAIGARPAVERGYRVPE